MPSTSLTPFQGSIRMQFSHYGRFLAVVSGIWLAWSGYSDAAFGTQSVIDEGDMNVQEVGELLDGNAIELLVNASSGLSEKGSGGKERFLASETSEPFSKMLEDWDVPKVEESLQWNDDEDTASRQDTDVPDADYLDLVNEMTSGESVEKHE